MWTTDAPQAASTAAPVDRVVRVAITGAGGRLGRGLMRVFGAGAIPWMRPAYDLDDPKAAELRVTRDRPRLVIHAAAWTDVDACARNPELATRRNATAVRELAAACAAARIDLVVVSTNEVFRGDRCDGAYTPDDEPVPINAYGESKLAGERAAQDAFAGAQGARLFVVRTAWLFGEPGNDFPEKILHAARAANAAGSALRLVDDEIGSPTYAPDVARFIHALVSGDRDPGTYHAVNAGRTSRADWALEILSLAGEHPKIERVPLSTWRRDSTPPRCAALAPTLLSDMAPPRAWQEATAEYLPLLLRRLGTAAPR